MLLLLFGSGVAPVVVPPAIVGGIDMFTYIQPTDKEAEELLVLWAFWRELMG